MIFSKYNILIDNILYNTKTKSVIELDENTRNKIKKANIDNFSSDEINILKENGFLIEKEKDDYEDILNQLEKVEKENLNIIFFATLECNFRCLYCYEDHINEYVSRDQYNNILNIIKELKEIKCINISWFGGEPTIRSNDIIYFLTELNEYAKQNNIKVTSNMTTNFYLVNYKLFTKFLELGLRDFQVTLDGLATTHDKYRPLVGNKGSFDQVNENLLSAKNSEEKFKINLRLNFDKTTDYTEYLTYINKTFLCDSRFKITIHEIGQWGRKLDFACEANEIENRYNEIWGIMKKIGIPLESNNKINFVSSCYACYKNSICIMPNGNILKCTVHLDDDNNIVGNLNNNTFFIDDSFWTNMHFKECPKCIAFPTCLGKLCIYRTPKTFSECNQNAHNYLERLGSSLWE